MGGLRMSNIPHGQELQDPQPSKAEILARLWEEFQSSFPTETDCLEQLYKGTYDSGIFTCRHCHSADVVKNTDGRTINCKACRKTTWLTAGTFFRYIKRPKAWWAAIWLRGQGVALSISAFTKLVNVAYPTAWNISRKLDLVIANQMPPDAMTTVASAFVLAICKRSVDTPARAHPYSEIADREKESPCNFDGTAACPAAAQTESSTKLDGMPSGSDGNPGSDARQQQDMGLDLSTDDGKKIHMVIERESELCAVLSEQPIHFDELVNRTRMSSGELSATLTMMELSGAAKRLAGDHYVRSYRLENQGATRSPVDSIRRVSPAVTLPVVQDAVHFLRATFHGVSLKYLQLCLAAFWCHVDRATWACDYLLEACQKLDPIRDSDVKAYVSPVLIKLACGQQSMAPA